MSLTDQITLLAQRVRDEFNALRATERVKAATTGAITFTGTKSIDGVACGVGDRVLVKDQTTTSQNGVYVVATGTWARAADYSTAAQLAGAELAVDQGATNGGTRWTCGQKSTDAIGTGTWTRVADSDDINALAATVPAAQLSTRRTGAVTNATTAFANCLTLNVEAGKAYYFRARGQYQSSATTTGIGLTVGGTCTATAIRAEATAKGLTTTSHYERSINALAQNTASGSTAVAAATDYHFTVEGEIRVATAGVLAIQFRSSTPGTITIQADSTLIAQELP